MQTQLRAAAYANVSLASQNLRSASSVLDRLVREDGLLVVGAVYDIETGVVDFFEGAPA